MRDQGKEAPEVARVVLAKATGAIKRLKNKLGLCKEELSAINNHKTFLQLSNNGVENQRRTISFTQLQKEEQKEIAQLKKKIRWLEKNQSQLKVNNLNSVAFVSFKNTRERNTVLGGYNKAYNSRYLIRLFQNPKFRISPAKQPESINWDTIGYSDCKMKLRAWIIRPLLFLLVPLFITTFFAFNLVFSVIHYLEVVKTKLFVVILNITLFFTVKLFSNVTLKAIEFLNKFELEITKHSHLARQVFISAVLKVFYLYLGYAFLSINELVDKHQKTDNAFIIVTDKVVNYLLTCSYLVPGLFIFQVKYIYSVYMRYRIKRVFDKKNRGDDVESKYLHLTQGMLNKYYERPDMGLDLKYSQIYSFVFLNSIAGLKCPLLTSPLIFFLIVVTGGIYLKLIYSRYKRPCHEFKNLSDNMMRRLILLPKMLTLGLLIANIYSGFTMGTFQEVILLILLALFFVNFDFVLMVVENYVKNKCLENPFKRCKNYEENVPRFVVDYESEYRGLNHVRERMSRETIVNEGFELAK